MPKVVVLLQPAAADWEMGHLLPFLRHYLGFDVWTATPDGRAIRTAGGLELDPDGLFDTADIAGADLVVLVGSDSWQTFDDDSLYARLRQRVDAGKATGAICAGTLALARAGILKDRPHSSNGAEWLAANAAGYEGEAFYKDVPHAVSDGVVITAGGLAPISFAIACAEAACGPREEISGFWSLCRAEFDALGHGTAKIRELGGAA